MEEKKKTCQKVSQMLDQFLDGELSPADQEWVEERIESCQDCKAELSRLRKLRALVHEVYFEEARRVDLDALLPGVMARVKAEKVTLWQKVLTLLDRYRLGLASPMVPVGVAATVAVAVIAFTLVYVSSGGGSIGVPGQGTTVAVDSPAGAGSREAPVVAQAPERAAAMDDSAVLASSDVVTPRRPAHAEKPFKRNEFYITYYNVDSGTVVIDVDPDGDEPAVVWHFDDDGGGNLEDNRI
jgi:anti-sigma factor RsiW